MFGNRRSRRAHLFRSLEQLGNLAHTRLLDLTYTCVTEHLLYCSGRSATGPFGPLREEECYGPTSACRHRQHSALSRTGTRTAHASRHTGLVCLAPDRESVHLSSSV